MRRNQTFMRGSQKHLRQMIAFHINPTQLPTHSVPTLKKSALSAHIHKGSLMASRGTRGPSPQTETFHRPTGRAEKSQEKNIKSERDRERRKERKALRECENVKREDGFIMSGIGMMPHWGLLVSLYIQWQPHQFPSVATMQSPQFTLAGILRLLGKTCSISGKAHNIKD